MVDRERAYSRSPNRRWIQWLLFLLVASEVVAPYRIFILNLQEILFICMLIVSFFSITLKPKFYSHEVTIGTFVIISIIYLLTITPLTEVPSRHASSIPQVSKTLLIFLMILYWTRDKITFRMIWRALIVVGVVGVVGAGMKSVLNIGLNMPDIKYSPHSHRLEGVGLGISLPRTTGFLGSMGNYGSFVTATSLLVTAGLHRGVKKQFPFIAKFWWAGVVLVVVSLLFSQSRSGVAAAAVGYASFLFLSVLLTGGWSRHLLWVIMLSIALLGFTYGNEIWSSLVGMSERNIGIRMQMNWIGIDLLTDRPLTGWGLGYPLKTYNFAIHNAFLKLGASTGTIPMVSYMALSILSLKAGLSVIWSKHPVRMPLTIALLSSMLAILTELFFYGGVFHHSLFIITGLILALRYKALFA